MALLSLDDAKAQLNIASTDMTQDVELQAYVDAVQAVVERHTGELMTPQTVVEYHEVHRRRGVALDYRPVTAVTSVVSIDGLTTWDVAGVHVEADLGFLTVITGDPFDGKFEVTYTAGYASPPANYSLAARIIVQHLWETQRGSMSVPFAGSEQPVTVPAGFALPYRALELLGAQMPGIA